MARRHVVERLEQTPYPMVGVVDGVQHVRLGDHAVLSIHEAEHPGYLGNGDAQPSEGRFEDRRLVFDDVEALYIETPCLVAVERLVVHVEENAVHVELPFLKSLLHIGHIVSLVAHTAQLVDAAGQRVRELLRFPVAVFAVAELSTAIEHGGDLRLIIALTLIVFFDVCYPREEPVLEVAHFEDVDRLIVDTCEDHIEVCVGPVDAFRGDTTSHLDFAAEQLAQAGVEAVP